MLSTIEETLKHISFIAQYLHNCDSQYIVIIILMELGLDAQSDGFEYLKEAIPIYWNSPAPMVTKDIYPVIAKMYNKYIQATHIEHSIRTTINKAWETRDDTVWRRYFTCKPNGTVKRPTNAEFMSRISAILDLWKGCCIPYENQPNK